MRDGLVPSHQRSLTVTESGSHQPARRGVDGMPRGAGERIVRANGVDLCVETFGDPANPAILLIHGAGASMHGWGDEFCARLAAGSRFVIRYDHRDTGRSVSYDPGAPPYSLRDLTADAIGVLDALAVDRAHLVGMSMGGGIAMLAAREEPDRVASLTLVATSPGGPDLPPMSAEFLAYVGGRHPDWSDRQAVIDHIVGLLRVLSGDSGHFDEASTRDLVDREIDRTVNVASSQINHFVMDVGEPSRHRLGEICAPTLVVHGDRDPVFPLGHALALEQEIPDARLLILERTGHELPRATWDVVVPAIVRHTAGGHRGIPDG
jgi:pimeloyl-ACP methyl ester carboxylesterase